MQELHCIENNLQGKVKKIIENSQKKITKKQKDMETQGGVSIAQKCSIQTEIHPQKFIKFKSKVKTKSNKLTSPTNSN